MADELLAVPGLSRTTPYFRSRLVELARANGFDPNAIAAVISLESGFVANAPNRQGKPAQGLLQWWREYFPPVAKAAGMAVTWDDLHWLSAEQQLPLVMATFRLNGISASSSPTDYLLSVFLPTQLGKPRDTVLGRKDSADLLPGTKLKLGDIYGQNQVYDTNADGVITVGDLTDKIGAVLANASAQPRVLAPKVPAPSASAAWVWTLGAASLALLLVLSR
jgi:hypothetical protein